MALRDTETPRDTEPGSSVVVGSGPACPGDEFGNTAEAAEWLTRNKISPQAQAEGLRVYKVTSK